MSVIGKYMGFKVGTSGNQTWLAGKFLFNGSFKLGKSWNTLFLLPEGSGLFRSGFYG